ncbi:MAG TPA: VCBS repeat-containing protein [Thermoanaerobaculia bacterium]|nr:VCBS repeat-containing protein [Thermoanaerobaculia bacterium]
MARMFCWLVAAWLLLAPSLATYAQNNNTAIVTAQDDWGLSTFFDGSRWSTSACRLETQIQGLPAWGVPSFIRVGDFDGNGMLDIASPRANTIMIKSIIHDGIDPNYAHCLKSLPPFFVTEQWGSSEYTWVGDFNGDGKDDLASAQGSSVYMKLSNPGPFSFNGFTSHTWTVAPSWGVSGFTFVGDFNGDRRDDIASAQGGSVYMKISDGNQFISNTWGVTSQWGIAAFTRVGDFNGDGLADIASASGGQVYMKLSTGAGFISTTWSVANTWGGGDYTWVADFNRDGRADIASAQGGVVHMKLSQGSSFLSQDWPVANLWGHSSYTWIIDYNLDGYKDIISAEGPQLFIKRNDQGRGFISETADYFGWWSTAEFTWALDRSRFSWWP